MHFRPGFDSLAARAAREAEWAWTQLARELEPPRESVDLVLSDAADFANGSATVFPSNRILLLPVPPLDEPELENYDDWLRNLVTHELAHVFHLDRVRGIWALIQAGFGRVPGAFPNVYQPSWVAEGLATYYESRLTGRGRVYGSFHDQLLVASARSGRWLSPGEATFLSPRWPDGLAPYAYGSRFFDLVARTAGDSAVPRFVERTAGQWIPFRTGYPLKRVSGLDRDSLWDRMRLEYLTAGPGATPETVAHRLRSPPAPAASLRSDLAWFESTGDEAAMIAVRRGGATRRYRTTGGVDLAWVGDTLYATRLTLADPFTYRSDLFRLDPDGEWRRITHQARVTDLAGGPNGVVMVQVTQDGNRLVILSGDTVINLGNDAPGTTWATPTIHPSGDIVAVQHDTAGYHLVSLVPGTDREIERLTSTGNIVLSDPVWSPDGSMLFFVSDQSGLPQVQVLAADGAALTLTSEPGGARQPVPSPDGWLYYTAYQADGFALKRIRWDPDTLASLLVDAAPPRLAGEIPEARIPAPAPLDTVPLRWTGYAPGYAVRPHYWIPLAIDKGEAGIFFGAFTSGSDPVGRLAYGAQLTLGSRGLRADGVLSVRYQRWAHHALDLLVSQDWGDAGVIDSPPAKVVSRERDLQLGFSTIWQSWYRALTLRLAGQYEQDAFSSTPALGFINPEFAGGTVTLGWSALERPPLAISAENGFVLSARYRRRWRLDQPGWSEDWRGRLALYWGIPGIGTFAHPVLAARVGLATASGPDREIFGVGGESGIGYQPLPGVLVGSSRQFPVRGYSPGEIRGATAAVGTAELRLPLALVARTLGDLPYGLDRLSLSGFLDLGRVWRVPGGQTGAPRRIVSTGVELVWDLSVLYDVPLRLRTGLAVPLRDGSSTRRGEVAVGVSFGTDF